MKRLLKLISVVLAFTFMFAFSGCLGGSKKYSFTHENGNVSSFCINFDDLTGSYEGYPINVVLRNGMNYKYVSGATQKCTGTLVPDTDGYEGWYVFETSSWSLDIIVDSDSSIRCRINGVYYTFNN